MLTLEEMERINLGLDSDLDDNDFEMELDADLYWKTKEGRKILISQMETSHIANVINMLVNRAKNVRGTFKNPDSFTDIQIAQRLYGSRFKSLVKESEKRTKQIDEFEAKK